MAGDKSNSVPRRRRRWLALLLGFGVLLIVESLFHLAGWGEEDLGVDPFVGFEGVQPLFVLENDGRRWSVPKVRQEYFRPESFAATKPANQFRVFVLGGSTVQGRPYAIETAFSTWLELTLPLTDPSRDWECVNCGGVSYASYRLAPILEEILARHQPDLIVLYLGHNEFLEDRAYDQAGRFGSLVAWGHQLASHSRVYRSARTAWAARRPTTPKHRMSVEVDTLLDHEGGLGSYRRDDDWRQGVVAHFRYNIARMLRQCRSARVPVVLCNPVANLKDCPPFKFDAGGELEARWNALKRNPQASAASRVEALRRLLRDAPRHAGLHYHVAKSLDAIGEHRDALSHYRIAKDEDLCPLRILESMRAVLREEAERHGAIWVDVASEFQQRSEPEAVGERWMIDHVHPSIPGHQLIAQTILERLIETGLIAPPTSADAYQKARRERFAEHWKSLDEVYFARGQQRLEGLRLWTLGRAKRTTEPDQPEPAQQ